MAQSIAQIRTDIEQTKESISQTVQELEGRMHELRDWQVTMIRYPILLILASVGVGIIISGGLTGPRFKTASKYGLNLARITLTGLLVKRWQQGLQQAIFKGASAP